MTEVELIKEISERLGEYNVPGLAREVVRLMRYAAEHAKVTTDLTTTGRVHYTHFVPGLPEEP
jgi:hypothetical protein